MERTVKPSKPGREVFFDENDEEVSTGSRSMRETDTGELKLLLNALRSAKKGDFSVRLPPGETAVMQ